jgi:hypothetical protein
VKHAGPDSLDRLDALLVAVRQLPGLQERKRGVFYRRSRAFLHFHEDAAGLFADVRLAETFERFPVSSRPEQDTLVHQIRLVLGPAKP